MEISKQGSKRYVGNLSCSIIDDELEDLATNPHPGLHDL